MSRIFNAISVICLQKSHQSIKVKKLKKEQKVRRPKIPKYLPNTDKVINSFGITALAFKKRH